MSVLVVVGVLEIPTKNYVIKAVGEDFFHVGSELVMQRLGIKEGPKATLRTVEAPTTDKDEPYIDSPLPYFKDIGDTLGDLGRSNSLQIMRGATVFDANGDGLLDVYFTHSGRPVAKKTDERKVLLEEKVVAKPSVLYINKGNNDKGEPIFISVQELTAKGNSDFVKEELLIENKYKPRESNSDDKYGPGRIGHGAVSADFNGDGLPDLYVANNQYGFFTQTEQYALRIYPTQNNLGRETKQESSRVLVRSDMFLNTNMDDGMRTQVNFGGKSEAEGRNSLFINMGDKDNDGLPEWRDATDEAGVGGNWASTGITVTDFDRDGDLDIYVSNFADPDFWGFGATAFSGQRNQLYVNQLVETGKFTFIDKSEEFKVSGLHDQEGLADGMWNPITKKQMVVSEDHFRGRQVGEKADHTWVSFFADINHDNWPDLIVANDLSNRLRVYKNMQGKTFEYIKKFDDDLWNGCWMGGIAADYDGDLKEEFIVTSCGTQAVTIRNSAIFVQDGSEVNIWALFNRNYFDKKSTLNHVLLSYNETEGLHDISSNMKIVHSPHIAPDVVDKNNRVRGFDSFFEEKNIETSLTGLEFTWSAPSFDVDNDGDLDIYLAGALSRGNDNFLGDWSGNPGRMLINESSINNFKFVDRTLEYRLLDVTDFDYGHTPPRRPSPGTGWHKRDYIYLDDTDSFAGSGLEASKSKVRDIFRMHEAASNAQEADLNSDGYMDLIVTHLAGYNSLSPKASNLKTEFAGRVLAIPAPNKVINPPTDFQEGHTSVYINSGAPRDKNPNWVKIKLIDPAGYNHEGLGSRIVVNNKHSRRYAIGGSFGSVTEGFHVGLGDSEAATVDVYWSSGNMAVQNIKLGYPVSNRVICIDRKRGEVSCLPEISSKNIFPES